jgi:histidinol-phosphatase (PHP family)
MKFIYHIHDQCCRHASNTLEDVVNLALQEKYYELFFTEHIPLDDNLYLVRPTRNEIKNLRKRIDQINRKYQGKLKIHFGFETEYSKWNKVYFDHFAKNSLGDYFIFGNHYIGDLWKSNPRLVMEEARTISDLDEYYENAVLAMKSGLFSLYAHPDIWLQAYRK